MSVLLSHTSHHEQGNEATAYVPARITSFVARCVKTMPQAVSSLFFEPVHRAIDRTAIAGDWISPEWGRVTIHPSGTGSFAQTLSAEPGLLKVGHREGNRFMGLWWEARKHGGRLCLTLLDQDTLEASWTCTFRDLDTRDQNGLSRWTRASH